MINIAVIGMGYVGISNAILLSQKNNVFIFDKDTNKIDDIKNKKSPIEDQDVQEYLENKNLKLNFSYNLKDAISNVEFIVLALPTNYDETSNSFDTSILENVIKEIFEINKNSTLVIKSTIPVGFIESLSTKFQTNNIIFSPEFLREGKALHDNLYPSRIIIGSHSANGKKFSNLLLEASLKKNVEVIFTNSKEAESIKLFANTYLALRVSFFNELDTFAFKMNLNTKEIIKGVSLDERIGDYYNNPSFGYGGYCLPKDTKQLLNLYKNIPQELISAVVASNSVRKDFIANDIILKKPKTVGVYRLIMKLNSDNYRSSAIWDIIKKIKSNGVNVLIYEPKIIEEKLDGYDVIDSLEIFKEKCDLIIANRFAKELKDVKNKIYTRDVYNRD